MDYAWEKLSSAIDTLVSDAPMKKRLECAALAFLTLKKEHFFEEERVLFSSITERLHTHDDPALGSNTASAGARSPEQAERIARDIVSLFDGHMMSYVEKVKQRAQED